MSSQPWMKFYPADWRSDPSLRITSLAGRGLWIEMLAIMHEAEPRGHLTVKGKQLSFEALALMVGSDAETVKSLVDELEENGVFSRKKSGVIFSRRIEKDENKARKNRENGKMGGNPSLCNKTENDGSVNQEVKAKKPEARSQKQDNSSNEEYILREKKPVDILLEVIDQDHSQAIIEHRKKIKKPLSERAANLLANELRKCASPNEAADEIILRGWTGFKADWLDQKPRFQSQTYEKPKTRNQLHQEAVDRELAKIIHGEDHVEFTDNVIDLAQRDYRFTA